MNTTSAPSAIEFRAARQLIEDDRRVLRPSPDTFIEFLFADPDRRKALRTIVEFEEARSAAH